MINLSIRWKKKKSKNRNGIIVWRTNPANWRMILEARILARVTNKHMSLKKREFFHCLSLNSSPTTNRTIWFWISWNKAMISSIKLDCTTYHTTILWILTMRDKMSLFLFSINQRIPANFQAYRKKIKKYNLSNLLKRVNKALRLFLENPKKDLWKSKKLIMVMIF